MRVLMQVDANEAPSPYSREAHYQYYGSPKTARLVLVAIFLGYCAIGFFSCLTFSAEERSSVVPVVMIATLWTTALLGALWFRQRWALYALCGVLGLEIIAGLTAQWHLVKIGHPANWHAAMLLIAANDAMILLLIFVPSMKMLIRRR